MLRRVGQSLGGDEERGRGQVPVDARGIDHDSHRDGALVCQGSNGLRQAVDRDVGRPDACREGADCESILRQRPVAGRPPARCFPGSPGPRPRASGAIRSATSPWRRDALGFDCRDEPPPRRRDVRHLTIDRPRRACIPDREGGCSRDPSAKDASVSPPAAANEHPDPLTARGQRHGLLVRAPGSGSTIASPCSSTNPALLVERVSEDEPVVVQRQPEPVTAPLTAPHRQARSRGASTHR